MKVGKIKIRAITAKATIAFKDKSKYDRKIKHKGKDVID